MKYAKWYFLLISRAKARDSDVVVGERHHIVPRTLDGGNEKSNLVKLTHREHFLAHWLLVKFTCGSDQRKMNLAFFRMSAASSDNGRPKLTSWQYERARLAVADAMKGNQYAKGKYLTAETRAKIGAASRSRKYSAETRAKIGAASRSRKYSAETRARMSAAKLGKPKTAEHRERISAAKLGKPKTAETRARMSAAQKSRRKGDLHV